MKLKKPKFWDYKKPNFLSNFLFPISKFYELVLKFQPTKNIKKINSIKTICVGNIYIGGTGKTSFSIELMKLCDKMQIKACFIKKFYSDQIDEQKLLEKFGKTFINKSRSKALDEAAKNGFKIAIFDDGLQDKDLNYDLKIVCFDANNWIGNGQLIPAGPLREKLNSLKKYDIVFLKNHNSKTNEIKEIIKKQNPLVKIFQMSLNPENMQNFDLRQKYLIFSGIGDPKNFKKILLDNNFKVIKEIIFPDHYDYQKDDIDKIRSEAEKLNASIVTTEKDFVKINKIDSKKINFLKISLEFDKEVELIDLIKMRLNEKN